VPRALRHRTSWLAYRSSWRLVSSPGSWSGMSGQLGAIVLLGYHVIEPGQQVAPLLRYGLHPVVGRDGVLKLAPLVSQLGRGQRIQGMFRLLDVYWVGGYGRLVLTGLARVLTGLRAPGGDWPDALFPLPTFPGRDSGLKGLGSHLQPAGPVRERQGRDAILCKGDGMPGKRDLDPEMSPLHFFGAEVRRRAKRRR
jgi:hypothetical protein